MEEAVTSTDYTALFEQVIDNQTAIQGQLAFFEGVFIFFCVVILAYFVYKFFRIFF